MNKSELKSHVNHTFANLASWVTKGHPVFKALKEFAITQNVNVLKEFLSNGTILNYQTAHNTIVMTGRNALIRRIAGDTTYSGEVTRGAVGLGTTPFTDGSTKLVDEIYRLQPNSQSFENDIAYCDFFIGAGDCPDQTYTEWGTFIDGTDTKDSGQAFSLIQANIVKTGSFFISSKYQILNA